MGTAVREKILGRRFISPPREVGVFSPRDDKYILINLELFVYNKLIRVSLSRSS